MHYNQQIVTAHINDATKTAIGFIAFGVPPILVLLALIVFVRKFKLYGDLADKVHAYIVDREHKRTDGESI